MQGYRGQSQMSAKLCWLIRGYDSSVPIYETRIDVGQITENQIKALLMALAAKAGLTYDEIVGAYAKKRTRIHNELLCVKKDGQHPTFTCGTNPHFVAANAEGNPDGTVTMHRERA